MSFLPPGLLRGEMSLPCLYTQDRNVTLRRTRGPSFRHNFWPRPTSYESLDGVVRPGHRRRVQRDWNFNQIFISSGNNGLEKQREQVGVDQGKRLPCVSCIKSTLVQYLEKGGV
jgi:hypothetical protein